MDNANLVDAVRNNKTYLDINGPISEDLLEAIGRVDRKQFLPKWDTTFGLVPLEPIVGLHDSLEDVNEHCGSEEVRSLVQSAYLLEASAKIMTVPLRELAYNDVPLQIGQGQTCSQPSMVALMAGLSELKSGMRVLEIGTGCGYHAAVSSEIVGREGIVVSIERIPELAEMADSNLRSYYGDEFNDRFTLHRGDGSMGAAEEMAPFDSIYLTAGVRNSTFQHCFFVKQLKEGGIFLYPEAEKKRLIKQRHKLGDMEGQRFGENVQFVSLIGENT